MRYWGEGCLERPVKSAVTVTRPVDKREEMDVWMDG